MPRWCQELISFVADSDLAKFVHGGLPEHGMNIGINTRHPDGGVCFELWINSGDALKIMLGRKWAYRFECERQLLPLPNWTRIDEKVFNYELDVVVPGKF